MNKYTAHLLLFALALAPAGATAKERTQADITRIAAATIAAAQPHHGRSAASATLHTLAATKTYTVMGYAGGGFAVIANDDAHAPVIGYSPSSAFSTTANPALEWYLTLADAVLAGNAVQAAPRASSSAVPADCPASVSHLIETKWNQDDPYWAKCPKDGTGKYCYTGCVATAMAQIMRYYKYPATGIGRDTAYYNRHPYDVDFAAAHYDYDNMIASYSGSYTVAQKLAVATLMYHCGVATSMTYGTDGSGAYLADAARGLADHFGYVTQYYGYKDYPAKDNYDDQAWRDVVYHELALGHPLLYAGASDKNGTYNMSYHAFVLDGYDASGNVGVNWGYSGMGDGYFSLDILECSAYTPSEQYSLYHEMVVVHHPDDGPITYSLAPATGIQTPALPADALPADDAAASAAAALYDAAGRRLAPGTSRPGLVIVRQGNTTRKMLAR